MPDDYMVINGTRYRITSCWPEAKACDGRTRWGVVTEGEDRPSIDELVVSVTKPVTAGYLLVDGTEYTMVNGRWESVQGGAEVQPLKVEATAPQDTQEREETAPGAHTPSAAPEVP
jgi:hypothetical protein